MRGWLSGNDEIYRLYEQAQVVLVPSVWPENLPTVCIEAMAIGRPVVGTKTGGIPELISDGESGLVVPMRDSDALAHAMLELFTNAPMREEMGKSARARAEHFRIERFAAEILGVYKEVIGLVETPFVAATEIVDGVSEEVVEIIDDVPHDTQAEAKEKAEQAPL